jgi:hypothetical protein
MPNVKSHKRNYTTGAYATNISFYYYRDMIDSEIYFSSKKRALKAIKELTQSRAITPYLYKGTLQGYLDSNHKDGIFVGGHETSGKQQLKYLEEYKIKLPNWLKNEIRRS